MVREDGAYGPLVDKNGQPVQVLNPLNGQLVQVEWILDLKDPNTRIYEAHYAITKEWAETLVSVDASYASLIIDYDRLTHAPGITLGEVAAGPEGSYAKSFHFALNDYVAEDNRIPPYGYSYDEARRRNTLPVPEDHYGDPGPGGTFDYWDSVTLNPPPDAVYATIDLLYQGTSWEYVQFLWKENDGQIAFLANEGVKMLDAWLNTEMAYPYVMVSTTWGQAPVPPPPDLLVSSLLTYAVGGRGAEVQTDTFKIRDTVTIKAVVVEVHALPLSGAQVFVQIVSAHGSLITSLQGFSDDTGTAVLKWKTDRRDLPGLYTANVVDVLRNGYVFNSAGSVTSVRFRLQ